MAKSNSVRDSPDESHWLESCARINWKRPYFMILKAHSILRGQETMRFNYQHGGLLNQSNACLELRDGDQAEFL